MENSVVLPLFEVPVYDNLLKEKDSDEKIQALSGMLTLGTFITRRALYRCATTSASVSGT